MEARAVPINIEDEIRKSYLEYALSVIIGLNAPDVLPGNRDPWGKERK